MNELIPIQEKDGQKVVSAKDLYLFLGFEKSNWGKWYKKNILENSFAVENEDWVGFVLSTNGNETKDVALTLDFAKRLSMMARTEKGEQARKYFIECEKKLKEVTTSKPATQAEALLHAVQLIVVHEQRLSAVESKLNLLLETQEQNIEELKQIDRSTEVLPEETLRAKVLRIVNTYARAKSIQQQEVWNLIYDRLYYLYHVSIKSYKKQKVKESWLDVAERVGHLEKIYIIASNLLNV